MRHDGSMTTKPDADLIEQAMRVLHASDLAAGRSGEAFEEMNDDAHAWYRDNATALLNAGLLGVADSRKLEGASANLDVYTAHLSDTARAVADVEGQAWARIGQVAESAGKVAGTFASALGYKRGPAPIHDSDDVTEALLDTALSALAALHHLRDDEDIIDTLLQHLDQRANGLPGGTAAQVVEAYRSFEAADRLAQIAVIPGINDDVQAQALIDTLTDYEATTAKWDTRAATQHVESSLEKSKARPLTAR